MHFRYIEIHIQVLLYIIKNKSIIIIKKLNPSSLAQLLGFWII